MAMYKFTATGVREKKSFTLLDRYVFEKGELIVSGKIAKAAKPLLCDFYACKMEKLVDEDADNTIIDEEDEEETE